MVETAPRLPPDRLNRPTGYGRAPRASEHSGAFAETGVANCFLGGGFTIPYKTGCFVLCPYKFQIYRVDYSL